MMSLSTSASTSVRSCAASTAGSVAEAVLPQQPRSRPVFDTPGLERGSPRRWGVAPSNGDVFPVLNSPQDASTVIAQLAGGDLRHAEC